MQSPEDGVLDGFLAAAGANPQRPAIRYHGRDICYADLATSVRSMARRLGPRPGVVGVLARHAPGTIVGLLGTWLARGVYCPLDSAFPEPRRRAMVTAAGCRTLLDPGRSPGSATEVELTTITDGAVVDDPEPLAYILFTSGSTGEPKPVATPHRAIQASVRSVRELFGVTAADRVLQFASLNWDTCFEEILPALVSGACVVFDDDAYTGSFPRLLRLIDRERISVLNLPTAYWHELVHFLTEEDAPLPRSVRLVVIGGEAVSASRLADWCRLPTGHARLVNTYGCTETTLITHATDLYGPLMPDGTTWDACSRVPIGTPLRHVVEHVTDSGELLIGGPSLATGYRGQPGLTDKRFVMLGARRFFRTGDRVSRLPDGRLVHEGRLDAEVKIRGVRVNPAEVEAHIRAHPAVSEVAVTAVGLADHTVLAAYVVPRPLARTAGLDAAIIDFLRERVPVHLVPNHVRVVADLAYTASGKIDRNRIKEVLA